MYVFSMIRRPYAKIGSPFILLVILALVTFWLDYATRPSEHTKSDDLYRNPDYIAEKLIGVRTDHDQGIQRQFSAQKLMHYLGEEITQLEQVSFINRDPGKPLMQLSAERATVKRKGRDIDLMQNVTAVRGAEDEKSKITLVTDLLHLYPEENLVMTEHAVSISRHKMKIEAKGLEFNNRTGEMQLLSSVKAVNSR